MGDACGDPERMGLVTVTVQEILGPDTPVHCVTVGDGSVKDDRLKSYLDNMALQIDRVCDELRALPAIRAHPDGAFHAIGFSQ
ncbi:hypothetical protein CAUPRSCDRAFT_3920, partial [Caulochytrium protostelioides]